MIVIPRTSAILYVSSNSFSVMQMMWLLCKGLEPSLFFHFSFARCRLVADVSSVPLPESHLTSQVLRTSYMHPQFSYKMCSERVCVRVWLSFFESSQKYDSDHKKREKTWMFRTCVAGVYKTCHTTDAGILLGLGSVSYWRLHFVFISSAQGIFFSVHSHTYLLVWWLFLTRKKNF